MAIGDFSLLIFFYFNIFFKEITAYPILLAMGWMEGNKTDIYCYFIQLQLREVNFFYYLFFIIFYDEIRLDERD